MIIFATHTLDGFNIFMALFFLLVYHILPDEPLRNLTHTIAPLIKTFQEENVVALRYRPRLNKLTMFEKKNLFRGSEAEPQTSGMPQS